MLGFDDFSDGVFLHGDRPCGEIPMRQGHFPGPLYIFIWIPIQPLLIAASPWGSACEMRNPEAD